MQCQGWAWHAVSLRCVPFVPSLALWKEGNRIEGAGAQNTQPEPPPRRPPALRRNALYALHASAQRFLEVQPTSNAAGGWPCHSMGCVVQGSFWR